MDNRGILDNVNNFLGGLNTTIGNAFDTASLFVGNLAAYEAAKAQRENANFLTQYERGTLGNQYADVPGTLSWSNTEEENGLSQKDLITYGVVGLGVLAILKIVK